MRLPTFLLGLPLFLASSSAFFPIHVPGDTGGGHGSTSRREVGSTQPETRDLPTLQMSRRVPEGGIDPHERAMIQIENIKRRSPGQRSVAERQASLVQHINSRLSDYSYTVSVAIGTPGQTFELVVDTGAQWTWVPGTKCTGAPCEGRPKYDSSASSTSQAVNSRPLTGTYGFGSVSAEYFNDTIKFDSFSVPMRFGVATTLSQEFTGMTLDGLLGLGDSTAKGDYAASGDPSVIDSLIAQGRISQRVFGIKLSRSADNKDDGAITFGGYDKGAFTGDVNWHPLVERKNYWSIGLGSISANGGKKYAVQSTAVVDTGLSVILLPLDIAGALMSQFAGLETDQTIPSKTTYFLPCNTKGSITVTFGNVEYNITEKDIVSSYKKSGEDNMCYTTVYGRGDLGSSVYLGDPFLRNAYAIFDATNGRLGLGRI